MRILTKSLRTLNQVNRSIWLLPLQNPPVFGVKDLFHPDLHNGNQDHTPELLSDYKKEIPTPKGVIKEDDYDLLACPPENLIHPQPDKTQKPKESP